MKKKLNLLILTMILFCSVFSFANAQGVLDEVFLNQSKFMASNFKPITYDDLYGLNKFSGRVILGNENLLTDNYRYLIDGKNIGIVTNQTGVDGYGRHITDILVNYPSTKVVAFYAPEHGIKGEIKAGKDVGTYTDKKTGLKVYSLYGDTRKPTPEMMKNIDVMVFDMQDIGSRTYTFMSTMYKCLEACKENNKTLVVLDRPNPIGCDKIEGFVMEDPYKSFVGIDNTPMCYGMTCCELAKFYNRNIGADLRVVPMSNYRRNMIWQDTGLPFVQTSPNIPNLESAFCYMATGSSDNTGMFNSEYFTWFGGKGLNSEVLSKQYNALGLEGVYFSPKTIGQNGGVKLNITDYHKFNPAKTGYYLMAQGNLIRPLRTVEFDSKGRNTMFIKIHGTKKFAQAIRDKKTPYEMEQMYRPQCDQFKAQTMKYYMYD